MQLVVKIERSKGEEHGRKGRSEVGKEEGEGNKAGYKRTMTRKEAMVRS
jgi:hypothetical protein